MAAESPERSGVLLLRVWTETGSASDLRVRVLAAEPAGSPKVLAPRVGLDGLLEVVRAWVEELTGGA